MPASFTELFNFSSSTTFATRRFRRPATSVTQNRISRHLPAMHFPGFPLAFCIYNSPRPPPTPLAFVPFLLVECTFLMQSSYTTRPGYSRCSVLANRSTGFVTNSAMNCNHARAAHNASDATGQGNLSSQSTPDLTFKKD